MPLISFTNDSMRQLVIPVYQRNYDWMIENCDQLLNDLIKLRESNRINHFFGSIVSAPGSNGYERLIIDGQQRLTTTSLLLLAGIKAVNDGKMRIENKGFIEQARKTFLWSEFANNPITNSKLMLIVQDREAYRLLFEGDESKFIPRDKSKITRNFQHFYDRLTTEQPFTFDELCHLVERLQVINISLDPSDDPQLIFESLNSTGRALQEADKIRNYLLMSLPTNEQEECHHLYWQKIEEATDNSTTMFLRDYLTISEQLPSPVREDKLYFRWKKYMEHRTRRQELEAMLNMAHYYRQVTKGNISRKVNGLSIPNEELSKKMHNLCILKTDVYNPFLMPFLKYADERGLEDRIVWDVIDLIENFMARRIFSDLTSNALTRVFCALHRDVLKSMEEYRQAGRPDEYTYSDILAYHLLRRDGNAAMPRDNYLLEKILTKQAYRLPKPQRQFIFDRLENFANKEHIDVAGEMEASDATIEHIMPQTLTPKWREMLGNNADEIHLQWLHTIANLTLTGVNTELSNNPFEEKKNGAEINGQYYNGYRTSKYRLTKEVADYSAWTEDDIRDRAAKVQQKFLALYPLPTPKFQPLPKPVDEIPLSEDDFNPTNRNLRGYRLFGHESRQDVWVDMYIDITTVLLSKYPDVFETLCRKDYWVHFTPKLGEKKYAKIGDSCYLWKNNSTREKVAALRYFFEQLDIDQNELVMLIEPQKFTAPTLTDLQEE